MSETVLKPRGADLVRGDGHDGARNADSRLGMSEFHSHTLLLARHGSRWEGGWRICTVIANI